MKTVIVMNVLNEEKYIDAFMEYYLPFNIPMMIWDSGSTDQTVEKIKTYADDPEINKTKTMIELFDFTELPDPEDFSQRKNLMHKIAKEMSFDWVIHLDCDERMDKAIMHGIQKVLFDNNQSVAYKFPRINLPNPSKTYPDYQVRIIKLHKGVVWKRNPHAVPFIPREGNTEINLHDYIGTRQLDEYPILHLARDWSKDRPWWKEET